MLLRYSGIHGRSVCSPLFIAKRIIRQGSLPALADSLTTVDGLRHYRDNCLQRLLKQKKDELQKLTIQKNTYEALAQRYVDLYAAALVAFLTAQFATLFYWVYFLFDWNLVEPITYLLGYGGVWISIACYGVTRQEFNYDSLRALIMHYYRCKLYQRHKFDIASWRKLEAEVKVIQERLQGLEGL